MKIAYLLDRPELGGGVKVVFQHAALLAQRGHRVWVAGRGPRPDWVGPVSRGNEGPGSRGAVSYLDLSSQPEGASPALPEPVDLLVATYWTTLEPARRAVTAGTAHAAAHLCQGFEPDWPHQRHQAERIETTYAAAALPALVVAPHLGERLASRLSLPWRLAPPPVDPRFRPGFLGRLRRRPGAFPWIAVPGIFQAEVKGVPVALEALRRLEDGGLRCRLLRISVLPPTEEEARLRRADRFLHGVPPEAVAQALRRCSLLLFPARPGEGFGLPLLEAMASGVPAVASRLPPTRFLAEGVLPLVPPDDPEVLAERARDLLESPPSWRRARREVLRRAARFAQSRIAVELDEAVRWAAKAGSSVAPVRGSGAP